jgi:glucan phosphoethanolaminetransferase (alkaline phosphatase superfamily)
MYLSDHGEQVFSGKCGKILHGNKTENEFKIPLITWYSDKYKKENEQKISALFQNREKPIDQTSAFPTLIDLANIEIDNYETDRSLANPLLPKYTRYIYDYLDFDKSKRVGACNELDK